MDPLRELDIVRAAIVPCRFTRAEEDGAEDIGLGLMEVRFSPFDVWYEIDSWWEGRFLERTTKGAFAKTMREQGARTKVLFNHGGDYQIGDKVLGVPSDLREDEDAAVGDVPLLDTSYNRDLLPGLRAGAYGSSFMFRVVKDAWDQEPEPSETNPEGIPERTITEVRLFEFGPVTWPANPSATAGMRSGVISMTDDFYARLRERDPERVQRLEERVRNHRTPIDREPPSGTPGGPGAAPTAVEPASRHSSGLTPRARRERLHPYLTKGASR